MRHVRRAAVAGTFYPARPKQLSATVDVMLTAAAADAARRPGAPADLRPKALIVPHAGYIYSGQVAAAAYLRLKPLAERICRVVLVGPCHRVPIRGLAVPDADAFATPLGEVPLDRDGIAAALTHPAVQRSEHAHLEEHALEVHLPFLQTLLPRFTLVPLVVGDADGEAVAAVLERLWGGDETLIVISSDLSHYLPYEEAKALDAVTCRAIEDGDGAAIGFDQACGRIPIAGLLLAARRHRLRVATLELCNSGDTAGDRRRVVGYGAWILGLDPGAAADRDDANRDEEDRAEEDRAGAGAAGDAATAGVVAATGAALAGLVARYGRTLVATAAASIAHGLAHRRPLAVDAGRAAAALQEEGASFVTLTRRGALRGCIGSAEALRPLLEDVSLNAFAAAFRDPRFPPLTADEADDLDIKVSVLSPPERVAFSDEADLLARLRPGEDGLVIESGRHRALFLPDVWQMLPAPPAFLDHLKQKAGLANRGLPGDLAAWRFASRSHAASLAGALRDAPPPAVAG